MKPIIIAFAIASIFTACNSKSSEPSKEVVGLDSGSLYKNNTMADTAKEAITPGVTKRVVETHSPDGTVTTTTTTSANKTDAPKASTSVSHASAPASTTVTQQPVAAVHKKDGATGLKDAAIGGVGGAVVGAVVSKKKGNGALIGGAVGAAGGYILGNEKDKKQGR